MLRGDKVILFLATAGPIGRIPVAPGTWGTLIALPIAYLVGRLPLVLGVVVAGGLVAAAVRIASRAEASLGAEDPGAIVIDEIAGLVVAFLGHPFVPASAVGIFLLFRLLDIVKPFPIGWAEKRLRGGMAVVMDDVLAGAGANLIWLLARVSGLV